jgi:hypothetical protein
MGRGQGDVDGESTGEAVTESGEDLIDGRTAGHEAENDTATTELSLDLVA